MTRQVRALLDQPHHVSRDHAPMPIADRAAQFAPFAALAGYGEAIDEAAAVPLPEWTPDDDDRKALDDTIHRIASLPRDARRVRICTVSCEQRTGTRYTQLTGCVRSVDTAARVLTLEGNTVVPLDTIVSIRRTEST